MQNASQSGRFQVVVTEDGRDRTSSTLTINNLTATDSGIVQCVADNPLGVASADTTLSVLSKYFLVIHILGLIMCMMLRKICHGFPDFRTNELDYLILAYISV